MQNLAQTSPSFLEKESESEVRQDKNKRNYKIVTFSQETSVEINHPTKGKIVALGEKKVSRKKAYEQNYLNQTADLGWSEPVGTIFLGKLVTKAVVPYEFTDERTGEVKTANNYTAIVLGDTTSPSFESAINSTFKSAGRSLIIVNPTISTPSSKVKDDLFA